MPIYEYRCDACDTVFEEWHRHAGDIMEEPCPKCHKPAHRLISHTSFVLKGGGWYVTEYGNRRSSDTSSSGVGTEASPDASTEASPTPAAPAPPPPAASASPAPVAASAS